ncbi:unnamed protein product [Discosporangium mesarthrocarpum]
MPQPTKAVGAATEVCWAEVLSAAMARSFLSAEQAFMEVASRDGDNSGACVVAAAVMGRHLCLANLGDCRGMYYDGENRTLHPLTELHHVSNPCELGRILAAGG